MNMEQSDHWCIETKLERVEIVSIPKTRAATLEEAKQLADQTVLDSFEEYPVEKGDAELRVLDEAEVCRRGIDRLYPAPGQE